jgi:hypothetical protein
MQCKASGVWGDQRLKMKMMVAIAAINLNHLTAFTFRNNVLHPYYQYNPSVWPYA